MEVRRFTFPTAAYYIGVLVPGTVDDYCRVHIKMYGATAFFRITQLAHSTALRWNLPIAFMYTSYLLIAKNEATFTTHH